MCGCDSVFVLLGGGRDEEVGGWDGDVHGKGLVMSPWLPMHMPCTFGDLNVTSKGDHLLIQACNSNLIHYIGTNV